MKMISLLILLVMSFSSFAGCMEDFQSLQDKENVKLVKERTIEIHNKRQMRYLVDAELKAVKNYIEFREFTFDGDNGLSVTTDLYVDRKSEKELGYRVSVTDGWEHSEVRYYLKSTINFPILYRVWNGQRRVSEYICQ
jgi:uncharacterized protein YpmS